MTEHIETPQPPSRRALLAGALGGIGAFVATAIGRAGSVRAADPNDVVLGSGNSATTKTSITNSTNGNTVFGANSVGAGIGVEGISSSYIGVYGESTNYDAIWGISTGGVGLFGKSTDHMAISGESTATGQPAIRGAALGNNTGVLGYSGSQPNPRAKTGVFGHANQDATSIGVWGRSPAGHGLHGESSTGWAGYFDGRTLTESYQELVEIGTPSAPPRNHARLFIRDNGNGKTQLCVRFHTGAVRVLATQA